MRTELDILAWKEYARKEGKAEGRAEGKAEMQREVVLRMKAKGMDEKTIADLVGISPEKVSEVG